MLSSRDAELIVHDDRVTWCDEHGDRWTIGLHRLIELIREHGEREPVQ